MKIIVPATSANVGPGFDSVGIAVTHYLTIEVLNQQMLGLLSMILEQGFRQMRKTSCSQQPCLSQLICNPSDQDDQ